MGDVGYHTNQELDNSPYIGQYFDALLQHMKADTEKTFSDSRSLAEMSLDPSKVAAREKKVRDLLHEQLKPLIEKAFDNHDVNQNGTLSHAESDKLFQNLVSQEAMFMECMGAIVLSAHTNQALKKVAAMDKSKSDKDYLIQEAEKNAKRAYDEMKKETDRFIDGYRKDKRNRDDKAFAVMDKNGNHQLEKEEMVQALLPFTDTNMKFIEALGFQSLSSTLGLLSCNDASANCAQQ